MLITNLINNNGNATANQFVITEKNKVSFQSYSSLVCTVKGNTITFGRDWDYSRTTLKHLIKFLNDCGYSFRNTAEIRKAINAGNGHNMKIRYNANMA